MGAEKDLVQGPLSCEGTFTVARCGHHFPTAPKLRGPVRPGLWPRLPEWPAENDGDRGGASEHHAGLHFLPFCSFKVHMAVSVTV